MSRVSKASVSKRNLISSRDFRSLEIAFKKKTALRKRKSLEDVEIIASLLMAFNKSFDYLHKRAGIDKSRLEKRQRRNKLRAPFQLERAACETRPRV